MFLHINNTMVILLKTASVRVSSIQIMQVRVQNKGKSVWKSRYVADVSLVMMKMSLISMSIFVECIEFASTHQIGKINFARGISI